MLNCENDSLFSQRMLIGGFKFPHHIACVHFCFIYVGRDEPASNVKLSKDDQSFTESYNRAHVMYEYISDIKSRGRNRLHMHYHLYCICKKENTAFPIVLLSHTVT